MMSFLKKQKRAILCAALFSLALSLWPFAAHATFIAPKRVMIEDRQRAATITIVNNGDKTNRYKFEWERRAQSPDGKPVLLGPDETLPGYQPADPLLSFSPRQIVLEPGQSQKVRIFVNRPADLAEGEYHSHMLIKTEPVKDAAAAAARPQTQGLSGVMEVITHTSIPVFVRHGKTALGIKLASAALVKGGDGKDRLRFTLQNNSTRSAYIAPELFCAGAGEDAPKAQLPTYKVYVEAKTITQDSPIPEDFAARQCPGNLRVRLIGIQDFEYKRKIIDEVPVM